MRLIKPMAGDDLRIVGFDGTPALECGYSIPLVYHADSQSFVKFGSFEGYTREEIQQLAEQKYVTVVPEWFEKYGLLEAPKIFEHAVVLYVTKAFSASAHLHEPLGLGNVEQSAWATIGSVRVRSCTEAVAVELMNDWARKLISLVRKTLMRMYASRDDDPHHYQRAKHLVVLARSIASDVERRSEIWTFFGLTMLLAHCEAQLQSVYDISVRAEFPGLTWSQYMGCIKRLGNTLREAARLQPLPTQTIFETLSKERKAVRSARTQGIERQRALAVVASQSFVAEHAGIPSRDVISAIDPDNDGWIELDATQLLYCASLPEFYLSPGVEVTLEHAQISPRQFFLDIGAPPMLADEGTRPLSRR